MTKSITTTTVHIELGTAFWLLMAAIIVGLVLWSVLGSARMASIIRGSVDDTFGRY